MFWPRLSARWREVRVVLGVARGPRGFQFDAAFLLVFSGCTHHASLFLGFLAPRAARASSRDVLAAFECVFARGACCCWCRSGIARVSFVAAIGAWRRALPGFSISMLTARAARCAHQLEV